VPSRLKPHRPSLPVAPSPAASMRLIGPADEAGRQGVHVGEMQRRRLQLAATEVVGESGVRGASIARICKRAGVSRRTFYEIFEDAEECLLAAFDMAVERLAQRVVPGYGGEGSWSERIRCALTVLLEQLDAEPDLACLCIVETLKAGPKLAERRGVVLAHLVVAVEEGRSESKFPNELPPLAGQGVVGGVLSVLHARLLETMPNDQARPLQDLTGTLMAMIVHPYLGSAAARKEIDRAHSRSSGVPISSVKDPFKGLSIRFTYRTARVLATIAVDPGASNRLIAGSSGIADEGQISRLLTRLQGSGLIENRGKGQAKGESNAWVLTERGSAVHAVLGVRLD
jgi:AcrR family transcriptional regulator